MPEGLLKGKHVLAVDDEPDVLDILGEELEEHGVSLDRASTYEEGIQKMSSSTYDLVILDIMGVRGFDLLEFAVAGKIPVVMLTAHALSPAGLKKSIELGARAYIPKDRLGRIAPFLEDVMELNHRSGWKAVLHKLGGSFGERFGSEWRVSEKEFRAKFDKDLKLGDSTITRP
jgi:CheY-like chemotaxis protein